MVIESIPFQTINWKRVKKETFNGEKGFAYWQTILINNIRIRIVEYSADYLADHWCRKGHVILCMEGEMNSELKDGRNFLLKKGMTYVVGDECEAHRTSSAEGCKLFIVD